MNTLFIINPISGKGRRAKIKAALEGSGHRVVVTEYAGHAAEIAAQKAREGIFAVVVKEGTVHPGDEIEILEANK